MLRCLPLFVAVAVLAQDFSVAPSQVQQGGTLHVRAPAKGHSARALGRNILLFPELDGSSSGLMPVPADAKPGHYELEILDAKSTLLRKIPIIVHDAHFASQNVVLGKSITDLKPAPGEMDESDAFRKLVSVTRYWSEPLQLPVPGCMTSPFGVRRLHNGRPTGHIHAGIDQRGSLGEPIHAVAGGVVRLVRAWTLHGNTVGIDHGQGLETMYQHMSKFAVAEGAVVKQGDVIGYVGSTGRSTAPHLHWTLSVNSVPVNAGQWEKLNACAAAKAPRRHKRKRT